MRPGDPPPFKRHQYGFSFGGPVRRNKAFFFGGYERLQEDLGLTLITFVPTAAVRAGAVSPVVKPYLDLYPLPNGADLGGGIAQYNYAFNRPTRENFGQARLDVQLSDKHAMFARHTIDKAHQVLPAGTVSLPQFRTVAPRTGSPPASTTRPSIPRSRSTTIGRNATGVRPSALIVSLPLSVAPPGVTMMR